MIDRYREWVEDRYRGNFRPPPADSYDRCVTIDSGGPSPLVVFLTVIEEPEGGWRFLARQWDGYDYCPHWSRTVAGIHAEAATAWRSAEQAAESLARLDRRQRGRASA